MPKKIWSFLGRFSGFPALKQFDAMDCGPTCLRMVARYYGRRVSRDHLNRLCGLSRQGVSFYGLSRAAERIGFRTLGIRSRFETLRDEALLPALVHWRGNHIVVVWRIRGDKVDVADPERGRVTYSRKLFEEGWLAGGGDQGVVLMLEPTPSFHSQLDDEARVGGGFRFLIPYVEPYSNLGLQLILGMVVSSVLMVCIPILTQALVDHGVNRRDLGFVYTLLTAQLMLFAGTMSVAFIRSWILLHIGARVNIKLISDFLLKLMRLRLSFFDTRFVGDIIQRVQDHRRIEVFLAATSLEVLFSLANLVIFSLVLAYYSRLIFVVFCLGTALYLLWIWSFMKRRKSIDERRFGQLGVNQAHLVEIVNGMHEIKLNAAEQQKRWSWEKIQLKLFRLNVESLALTQYQQAGSLFTNDLKNILITFLAAREVIRGEMTLGMMMAVTFIIGQLNGPVQQMLSFFQSAQDAKLSLDRLSEIHQSPEEETARSRVFDFPERSSIELRELSFGYPGADGELALDGIDLELPAGQMTAIVGPSGSGKTTLLKMLLGFYEPTSGEILIDGLPLASLSPHSWRARCGTVMQDGFIFSDTIAQNIALGRDQVDRARLRESVRMANLLDFVESLPHGFETRIGAEGLGLSQGQRQRILIARAIYKGPEILLFDEATSDLDTENERIIIGHLRHFFAERTVVVVAHRLSTVRDADQIVVLDGGRLVERGNHDDLVRRRGAYFHLVRNQLELNV